MCEREGNPRRGPLHRLWAIYSNITEGVGARIAGPGFESAKPGATRPLALWVAVWRFLHGTGSGKINRVLAKERSNRWTCRLSRGVSGLGSSGGERTLALEFPQRVDPFLGTPRIGNVVQLSLLQDPSSVEVRVAHHALRSSGRSLDHV